MDARVLAYTAAVMVGSVFLFGLWPAMRATKVDLVSPVRSATGALSHRRYGGRNFLATVQTALSTMLLVAAALFTQNFIRSTTANPGIRIDNVQLATFDPV